MIREYFHVNIAPAWDVCKVHGLASHQRILYIACYAEISLSSQKKTYAEYEKIIKVMINEIIDENANANKPDVCDKHKDKPLDIFCQKCEATICLSCLIKDYGHS